MARYDSEITYKIRDRISKFRNQFSLNLKIYHDETEFVMGVQWTEDESKLFERYNKIPLAFNKLGVLMNQLLAEQMMNTPNLQIVPDQSVPVETADIRAALVKNISLSSDAKHIYQTAFQQAVVGGFGAIRIGTEYENDRSMNQVIRLWEFKDPTRCYWDLTAESPCKTDGMYAGFLERLSRKRFKSLHGKSLERKIGSTAITDDAQYTFADDDTITIIYDYERVADKKTLYQLSDEVGTCLDGEKLKTLEKVKVDDRDFYMFNGQAVTVINKRDVPRYRIKYRKIAGDYILEEEWFPSEQLPIIFVDQKSYYDKKGKQITRPFFQDVKDAQRYLNYLATTSAYLVKTARYDQFIGPRKSVQNPDTQQIWKDPSIHQGMLVYDETPSGAKPEQLQPAQLSPALIQQYERVLTDIQSGTGMYQAQLGQQGNEVSRVAIDARTKRGNYNTYVPFNSLNKAIAVAGEIINEMIPKIYDTQRTLMLNMPEAESKPTEINVPQDEYGMETKNDMTTGDYKIRLVPGPSFDGQKEEARESMEMLFKANPQWVSLLGDLYVENLPFPNSMEMRNRIRTTIPPQIIEAGKTGKPLPPQPPQPNPDEQMMQLKQQELQMKMQDAQQKNQIKMQELQLKEAELQRKALETHNDMSFEWEKIEVQKKEAAAQLQEQILRYEAEMNRMATDAQISHADNLVSLLTHADKKPSTESK